MSFFGSLLSGLEGAGMGFLTGGPVGAAVGGLGALTSSKKPQNRTNQNAQAAQQAQQQLTGVGSDLLQRYQSAAPHERAIMDYFFQRAGLAPGGNAPGGNLGGGMIPGSVFGGAYGAPGTIAPMGTRADLNHGQPFALYGSRKTLPGIQVTQAAGSPVGSPGLVNGNLGIYNSPQYQLLRQQAGEDIDRNMVNTQHAYTNSLLGRGLQNSSLMTGGQAAITAGANKSYGDFVRQLAMGAADKQDQLAQQALGGLQGSLGAGAQAGGLFGQAGGLGQSGQQLNQAQQNTNSSALGSAIGAAAQYWGLGKNGGGGSSTDGGVGPVQGSTTTPDQAYDQAYGIKHAAHGGIVHAGEPIIVGDGSTPGHTAETFVPAAPHAHPFGDALDTLWRSVPFLYAQQLGGVQDPDKMGNYTPPTLFHSSPEAQAYSAYLQTLGSPEMQLPPDYLPAPGKPSAGESVKIPASMLQGVLDHFMARATHAQLVGLHGPSVFVPPAEGRIVPNPADAPAPAPANAHPLLGYLQALQQTKGMA